MGIMLHIFSVVSSGTHLEFCTQLLTQKVTKIVLKKEIEREVTSAQVGENVRLLMESYSIQPVTGIPVNC